MAIYGVDHLPPHCHVFIDGRNIRVDLMTMRSMSKTVKTLPAPLHRGLGAAQDELLQAWEGVHIIGRPDDE